MRRRLAAAALAMIGCVTLAGRPATADPVEAQRFRPDVFPTLTRNLVAFYDFEHPAPKTPPWNGIRAGPARIST